MIASMMSVTAPEQAGRVPWISPMDYPQSLHAERKEGTVAFQLRFNAEGRVTGCSVQQSSGTALLDAMACTLSVRRARARPGDPRIQSFRHLWRAPATH
jgi:TonB family protein